MYCDFNEFVFIVLAVVTGMLIFKFSGSIVKAIGRVIVKIGAKMLRAELKQIEIQKAIEKAEREEK